MRQTVRVRLALCTTLLVVAALGCTPAPPSTVVLIVLDTTRADRLSAYGHHRPTSPHIDRLAADAIRFEEALAQAPWTTPSIGSLLTSRYPSSLGIDRIASPLPADATLLSEELRDAGYATAAVVSHSFCSARWGFDRGFESFDESNVAGQLAVTSSSVADRALEAVARHAGSPFFLFVHFFDPHFALVEHEDFRFEGGEDNGGRVRSPVPFVVFGRADAEVTPAEAQEMLRIYDSEVAYTDHHVGRLLDDLRARGLYDDALIVLTADHGEEFLEHGRIGHTRTLHRELLRVPLLIKLPRGKGSVVREPVGLIDVTPTILDLVGVEAPRDLAGRSLLVPSDPPRPVFSETSRQATLRSVREGDLVLVRDVARRTLALYDVAADPGETRNLARDRPSDVRRLMARSRAWAANSLRQGKRAAPIELTDEERERLESLGYGE